jgi:hypothetical protein
LILAHGALLLAQNFAWGEYITRSGFSGLNGTRSSSFFTVLPPSGVLGNSLELGMRQDDIRERNIDRSMMPSSEASRSETLSTGVRGRFILRSWLARLFIEGSSPKARVLKGQGYVPRTFPLRARSLPPSFVHHTLQEDASRELRSNGVLRSSHGPGPPM